MCACLPCVALILIFVIGAHARLYKYLQQIYVCVRACVTAALARSLSPSRLHTSALSSWRRRTSLRIEGRHTRGDLFCLSKAWMFPPPPKNRGPKRQARGEGEGIHLFIHTHVYTHTQIFIHAPRHPCDEQRGGGVRPRHTRRRPFLLFAVLVGVCARGGRSGVGKAWRHRKKNIYTNLTQ